MNRRAFLVLGLLAPLASLIGRRQPSKDIVLEEGEDFAIRGADGTEYLKIKGKPGGQTGFGPQRFEFRDKDFEVIHEPPRFGGRS